MRNAVCAIGLTLSLLPLAGCGGGGGGSQGPSLTEQYQTALTLLNPESRATELVNVALKQEAAGDTIAAETSLSAAVEACAEIKDLIGRADAYNRVAAAQGKLALIGKAKDSLRKVHDLAGELESGEQKATLYAAMAVTYGKHLRKGNEARKYMKKAQRAVEAMDASQDKLAATISIAGSFSQLDMAEEADQAVQSVLDQAKAFEDARERANAITSVATALVEMHRTEKADAAFDEALQAANAIEDTLSKSHALADIAGSMIDAGRKDKARTTLRKAEAVADKVVDQGLQAEIFEKINQRRGRLR